MTYAPQSDENFVTVWRLEHSKTRLGPYSDMHNPDVFDRCCEHSKRPECPPPWADGMHHPAPYEIYGCPTLDALRAWFSDDMAPILSNGYRVVALLVWRDNVQFGSGGLQVSFPYDDVIEAIDAETGEVLPLPEHPSGRGSV